MSIIHYYIPVLCIIVFKARDRFFDSQLGSRSPIRIFHHFRFLNASIIAEDPPRKFRGRKDKMAVNWRPVESRTQARSPGVESQSRIERARNNGRSCYARRSCGRCPDYKRIAFFSLPLPSPRSRCKKQEGRTRDRATRRVTLFGAKQTKRKRFVRSKISARAVTGSLTTFLSFY